MKGKISSTMVFDNSHGILKPLNLHQLCILVGVCFLCTLVIINDVDDSLLWFLLQGWYITFQIVGLYILLQNMQTYTPIVLKFLKGANLEKKMMQTKGISLYDFL